MDSGVIDRRGSAIWERFQRPVSATGELGMNFLADSNRRRDAIVAAGADPQRLRADELEPLVYAVGGATDDPALAAPSAAALLRHLFAVNQKRDREPAVAAALMTLDSPPTNPASILRALLVLLYAEEFAQAESHLRRMLAAGEVSPVFAMLLARIVACQGRSREATEVLGTLLDGDLRADLTPAAVAWQVSALVDLGELEQANELLRLHGYDDELVDVPDRPELLAARGALHLAEGRFGLAYDDYSAWSRADRVGRGEPCGGQLACVRRFVCTHDAPELAGEDTGE
jgi:tetratricopeptide (TPR) repeat protein